MWIYNDLKNFLTSPAGLTTLANVARAAVWLAVGWPLTRWASRWAERVFAKKKSPQHGMILGKTIYLAGMILIVASVFIELGFKLGPLLGTAGVVGVAVGFASQTSLSNIISGLFLMAEQPFVVGDVISVGDATGQVLSIDLISVKIRTFDNKLVRVPNETIIKGQLTNVTRFPIRRVDLSIGVAYKEDLARVRQALMDVARQNPACLMEPEPTVVIDRFGPSSIELLFWVWAETADYLLVKNAIAEELKRRFEADGIEIPFPQIVLAAGGGIAPMPVRVGGDAPAVSQG